MQGLHVLLPFLLLVAAAAQGSLDSSPPASAPEIAPALAPEPAGDASVPTPNVVAPASDVPSMAPFSGPLSGPEEAANSPPSLPEEGPTPDPGPGPAPAPGDYGELPPSRAESEITWCAVREEFDDCVYYTSLLDSNELNWTCTLRESKGECMDAIKNGDADLIALEAGLAYIAFINYSMKAIMAEEYAFHAQSYGAVAVVNKQMCLKKPDLSLKDFANHKSCHPGYQTAGGWNYPVNALLDLGIDLSRLKNNSTSPMDVRVVNNFFSEVCAPSELGYGGVCSACGGGNESSCTSSHSLQYTGEAGAFRCLMDGTGDIAFLRAKTPQLYSSDGLNSQPWSTKSVDEFMYLCPSGGCKSINDNFGSCQMATVTANTVMARNNLTYATKTAVVRTLLRANWTTLLYSGKNWDNHVLSVSTQSLAEVNQLTRSYLYTSGQVTQMILNLNNNEIPLSNSGSTLLLSVAGYVTLGSVVLTNAIIFAFGEIF